MAATSSSKTSSHGTKGGEPWPDLAFATRSLRACDELAACEGTATATHTRPLRRSDLGAEPTGRRIEWRGVDVFAMHADAIARKDVHSDSVAILRAVGLLS